jgi:hypothetical protein
MGFWRAAGATAIGAAPAGAHAPSYGGGRQHCEGQPPALRGTWDFKAA